MINFYVITIIIFMIITIIVNVIITIIVTKSYTLFPFLQSTQRSKVPLIGPRSGQLKTNWTSNNKEK